MIGLWFEAITHAFSPLNLAVILGGTIIGIIFGALPGLGPTVSVALMITVSFKLPAETALILLGAVYGGAIYGGSISAILINAPGTPGSAATSFDGYPMSQQGKGGVAHPCGVRPGHNRNRLHRRMVRRLPRPAGLGCLDTSYYATLAVRVKGEFDEIG